MVMAIAFRVRDFCAVGQACLRDRRQSNFGMTAVEMLAMWRLPAGQPMPP
jgi:hypothetical protein